MEVETEFGVGCWKMGYSSGRLMGGGGVFGGGE